MLALVLLGGCSGAAKPGSAQEPRQTSSSVQAAATTVARPLPEPRALISPDGVVVPVLGGAAGRWRVRTPCGQVATVKGGRPVPRATVVLDSGHGGDEEGAQGANGLTEAALNLAVVKETAAALRSEGVDSVLTRAGDYRVTLAMRTELVRALQPQAFVSVHHNAEPDGARVSPGTETYYQRRSSSSRRLAGLVYEEVVRALAPYHLAWTADRDAGAKWRSGRRGDYYAVLRDTAGTPAVLAELAFLTNPPEAALLARADVRRAEGRAVARGIVRFLRTSDAGSGFVTPYARTEPAGPGGGIRGCHDPPL